MTTWVADGLNCRNRGPGLRVAPGLKYARGPECRRGFETWTSIPKALTTALKKLCESKCKRLEKHQKGGEVMKEQIHYDSLHGTQLLLGNKIRPLLVARFWYQAAHQRLHLQERQKACDLPSESNPIIETY